MTPDDAIAKIRWVDPSTQNIQEYILTEGATATIGRSSSNDIRIPEQHVSRQHAVISYRNGVFMINDLASSNGTFVNDEQVEQPFPLFSGDTIRLYEPVLEFLAVTAGDAINEHSKIIKAGKLGGQGSLTIANGPQEGQSIALQLDDLTIGRSTSNATWHILIQDPSVSRPHARLRKKGETWHVSDLGSSNGTRLNGKMVEEGIELALHPGDKLEIGGSILLFRTGMEDDNLGWNRGTDVLTRPID